MLAFVLIDETYVYQYVFNGSVHGIDAFDPDSGILRYANDEWLEPNCKMTRYNINNKPHLFLQTRVSISKDEELRYDYNYN